MILIIGVMYQSKSKYDTELFSWTLIPPLVPNFQYNAKQARLKADYYRR